MALRFVTSVTGGGSGGTTLAIPDDNVLPGDLAILFNWTNASAGSGVPAESIPAGFTKITGETLQGGTWDVRTAHSWKVLTHDDIGGDITIMSSPNFVTAARLVIFRADDGLITGVNVGSLNGEATTGDPAQQTVDVSGVSAPVMSFAHYLGSDGSVATGATFSPAQDQELAGFGSSLLRWRIDNSSPSNTTVDQTDHGDNILESFYVKPTVTTPPLWVAEMVTNGAQSSITIPSNAKAGDLAIFIDAYRDDTSPSINAPAGWNLEINDAGGQNIITRRTYARILQAGDPGTSINGLSGAGNEQKAILVLRGNADITAYSFNDIANTEGLGSVANQTVNASGGSVPLAVIAEYFGDGTFDWGDDATMTPAPDGRIRPEAATSFLRAAWKIYGSSPQDHTVGLTDPGTNDAVALRSYYVEVTGPSSLRTVSGSLQAGAASLGAALDAIVKTTSVALSPGAPSLSAAASVKLVVSGGLVPGNASLSGSLEQVPPSITANLSAGVPDFSAVAVVGISVSGGLTPDAPVVSAVVKSIAAAVAALESSPASLSGTLKAIVSISDGLQAGPATMSGEAEIAAVNLIRNPEKGGYKEAHDPIGVRFENDIGPAYQRPRYTIDRVVLTGRFIFTPDEVDELKSWYFDDLDSGAKSFSFTHPRTGASISARFDSDKGLAIRPLGAAYTVEFDIEIVN